MVALALQATFKYTQLIILFITNASRLFRCFDCNDYNKTHMTRTVSFLEYLNILYTLISLRPNIRLESARKFWI